MTERPLAITVEAVTKDFRLATEKRQTLKERVVNPRFDREAKVFHALRDINFEVGRGEFFGIVGRNGSGKSTLLKCMAGIYKLDAGTIKIGGRLSTFIELGVGFNPDLAARDNIILNGIMLGLTPAEAAERVDDVIAFAELEDHTDLKLKNYSSGMQVRLAFSVMTQIDADVLLIDEVLAVGDAAFQAKCFDVFRKLREAGKTIVLVTHDMGSVARFCDRALLMEDGAVVEIGQPEHIGDRYLSLNFERHGAVPEPVAEAAPEPAEAEVLPALEATRCLLVDDHEQVVQHVRSGDRAMIALDVLAREASAPPVVTVEFRDDRDIVVFSASSTELLEPACAVMGAGETWRLGVWFEALLGSGQLRVRALLRDSSTGRIIERSPDLLSFEVTSVAELAGVANLPRAATWEPLETIEQRQRPALNPVGSAPRAGNDL